MKRSMIVFLALVFFFPFFAGQAAAKDMTADDFVNVAKKSVHEISVSDAKVLLEKGGHVFIGRINLVHPHTGSQKDILPMRSSEGKRLPVQDKSTGSGYRSR